MVANRAGAGTTPDAARGALARNVAQISPAAKLNIARGVFTRGFFCVNFAAKRAAPVGFYMRMRRAIYPGSFDPVTNGHLDIIERGAKLFDEIIIAVLVNHEKKALFTTDERREMLEEALTLIEAGGCQLRVASFQGLLMRYAVEQRADAVVRGIRAISDYEYELQMALMNRRQEPRIETVFMMAAEAYSYVSSRLVKEVYSLGGTIEGLVPATVEERMRRKLRRG